MVEIYFPSPYGFMIVEEDSFVRIMKDIKYKTNIRPILGRHGRYYFEFTNHYGTVQMIHSFLCGVRKIPGFKNHYKPIDHKNGKSYDNRLENLELKSVGNNSMNRFKKHSHGRNEYIHIKKGKNSFYVRITKNKINYSQGGFKTIEEAIAHHKKILPEMYPNEYKAIFKLNGYVET